MLSWIVGDLLNHLLPVLLVLVALWIVVRALMAGPLYQGEDCHAPNRTKGGFCRHDRPTESLKCAAGHFRYWWLWDLFWALVLAVVAWWLISYTPLPQIGL